MTNQIDKLRELSKYMQASAADWDSDHELHCARDVMRWADELDDALLDLAEILKYPEAPEVCAEAYQVVGSLLDDVGLFDSDRGEKILDNLAQHRMVHDDVLPWLPAPSLSHKNINRVYAMGWTTAAKWAERDDLLWDMDSPAYFLDRGAALRTLEVNAPSGWLHAIDDEMVTAHLGVAEESDDYETAKRKLQQLIQWRIQVATDPLVDEQKEAVKFKPQAGEPPEWFSEWFIAKLDNGDRVVLRRLPPESTYDYITADHTFYMARRLKWWMQFPDSEFIPLEQKEAGGQDANPANLATPAFKGLDADAERCSPTPAMNDAEALKAVNNWIATAITEDAREVLRHIASRLAQQPAPVVDEEVFNAFDEITGLCRYLRQGGPDPIDLQELSDGLSDAIEIAANMLRQLSTQQPARGGNYEANNTKHVDTLRKIMGLLRDTQSLQGREHIPLGIDFADAIDYFAMNAQPRTEQEDIGAPIDATDNCDYLKKLADRIGGSCAAALRCIAADYQPRTEQPAVVDERAEFVKWVLCQYASPSTEDSIRRMAERYWDSEEGAIVLRPSAKYAWLGRAALTANIVVDEAMVTRYLEAQKAAVAEADRKWGRIDARDACRVGLTAALNPKPESRDHG